MSEVLDLVGPPLERVIFEEDLKRGLFHAASDKTEESDNKTEAWKYPPRYVHYNTQTISGTPYYIPPCHELAPMNQNSEKARNKAYVNNILKQFNHKICTWSAEAQHIFTAMSLFGYGYSDEGTRFIMRGAFAALF